MATTLTDTQTRSAVATHAIVFAAAPIGGFNAQASLGTASSATIRLLVRTHASATFVVADTLNLSSAGANTLNTPVYPPYAEAQWDITAIAGGTVILTAIGVGA